MPTAKQRAIALKREGFDDGVIGAILGLESDDVRALLYEAVPTVELPSGGGAVLYSTTDITYDQIVTLPTTSVPLVDHPGDDKIIVPFWAFLQMGLVGQFGGFKNASVSPNVNVAIGEQGIPKLSQLSPRTEFHSLFAEGESATMGMLQQVPDGVETTFARPIDDTTGGLELFVDNVSVGDFEPLDEGGYPDAMMRITVAYTLLDRIP